MTLKNIIILGAGRSGTSMTAGLFSKAGYYLGDNYLGKSDSNPKGFFEDREINQINETILKTAVPTYPEIIRKYLFPSVTFHNARWLARITPGKKLKSDKHIDERITERLSHVPFCYKDPRFSYSLPIWIPFLDNNTVFICVFRDPVKTARSIVKECKSSEALSPLEMNEKIALSVWSLMYTHVLHSYDKDNNKKRWLFIHFDQIISGQSFNTIQKFTGADIDYSFPENRYSRSRSTNEKQSVKLSMIYSKLNELADSSE
jgi:hypothetical protein